MLNHINMDSLSQRSILQHIPGQHKNSNNTINNLHSIQSNTRNKLLLHNNSQFIRRLRRIKRINTLLSNYSIYTHFRSTTSNTSNSNIINSSLAHPIRFHTRNNNLHYICKWHTHGNNNLNHCNTS